jgi:hypothetical protein
MDGSNAYYTAWLVYLLAVLGAQFLCWWMLRKFNSRALRQVLPLMLLAILITPATLDVSQGYWVPAFMAAFLGGLDSGFDSAIPRLWSIAAVMSVLVFGNLLVRFYLKKRQAAAAGKPAAK